jgi:amidophosphoribosyltransferase
LLLPPVFSQLFLNLPRCSFFISLSLFSRLPFEDITADVDVVFQSIENLHKACPNHLGDWYFSGDYPTPGGNKIVNKAFINYYEGLKIRAY